MSVPSSHDERREAASPEPASTSGWSEVVVSDVVSVDGGGPANALLEVEHVRRAGADVALVRFNRPESLNPMDKDTIAALAWLLETFMSLDPALVPDAVVLTGKGRAFSAGGDLKGYQTLYRDPERLRRFMDDFETACALLETMSSVTVAMVNGPCVAGGLELALACDLVTIADSARIGDGHLNFAQLPGAGSSQRLVKAIGSARATQWLLTGRLYSAEEAERTGLIALRAPDEELLERTLTMVADIARHTPLGREKMKKLISIADNSPLEDGLKLEKDLVFDYATTSHDVVEGLHAFAEKRPANYLGR